ncbi:hypothetical protein LSTR_LSTR009375, partial [Laodelphax striatellus]
AYNDYCTAIKEAHNIIAESYREYASKYCRNLKLDVFAKYLEDTGMIAKIKAHLRDKVQDYMVFKVGLPSKIEKEHVFQDFLAKSYIKLVEDMRLTVTNRNVDKSNTGRSVVCCYPSEVGIDDLHIFACEAAEEDDIDKAKSFLLKMIDMDFASPAPFIKMAIQLMQENNIDEAEVYTREIISIDTRHPIGVLLYAIILFLKEDFNTSELFFHAVTTFYPNFIEAWISFYFFYWHFQMFEQAKIILYYVDEYIHSMPSSETKNNSVTSENGVIENIPTDIVDSTVSQNNPIGDQNLNQEKVRDDQSINQEKVEDEQSRNEKNDNSCIVFYVSLETFFLYSFLFIQKLIYFHERLLKISILLRNVAVLSIKSHIISVIDIYFLYFIQVKSHNYIIFIILVLLYMFAEMCLNKVRQLSSNDEIVVIIEYLLACCDYLRRRPENALQHLDIALRFNIQPTPLHLLSGHCYYRMENLKKMEESYSFVPGVSRNPITFQLHLMYLRLGEMSFRQENFRESREFYYKSCKHMCTPLAWLGLAKTCYMLESYIEAERCLCEANLLDGENGEIWSYLALVNHKLNRPAIFLDCYNQTKRFPSNNEILRTEIGELYYSFYESNCFINRRTTVDFVDNHE